MIIVTIIGIHGNNFFISNYGFRLCVTNVLELQKPNSLYVSAPGDSPGILDLLGYLQIA